VTAKQWFELLYNGGYLKWDFAGWMGVPKAGSLMACPSIKAGNWTYSCNGEFLDNNYPPYWSASYPPFGGRQAAAAKPDSLLIFADSVSAGAYMIYKYATPALSASDLYQADLAYRHAGTTINLSFADGHSESRKRAIPCYTYGRGGEGTNFWPTTREWTEFWLGKYPFP
jgi:prepilin-type processing-associated H-X9-DG protein